MSCVLRQTLLWIDVSAFLNEDLKVYSSWSSAMVEVGPSVYIAIFDDHVIYLQVKGPSVPAPPRP